MTPQEQEQRYGEVIHERAIKCSFCDEQSSVLGLDKKHYCITHYLAKEVA